MRALVLSSGGLDSTTCVGIAVDKYGAKNVTTASIIYGQKHVKEIESSEKVAQFYGLKHIVLDLSEIFKHSDCSLLTHSSKCIEHKSYAEQTAESENGRVQTYVPFRNGLLLSTAAALADSLYPNEDVVIYYGAHADDAAGRAYADCSPEFAQAMNEAIQIGTYEKIKVEAPLINMNKAEVVKTGIGLGVPFQLTWSCYEGGEKQCGTCGTCIDRKNAFRANNIEDPVAYEK